MKEAFYSVQRLYHEGKLHKKLVIRIVLLLFVAILSLGVVLIDIIWRGLPLLPTLFFVLPGFLFGYFILSKINTINWDAYEETIIIGRFDWVGFLILLVYVGLRLGTHEYINGKFTDAFYVSGYTVAVFFGVVLGKFIGVAKRIHRISLGEAFNRLQ